jgi:hypothetical protein
VPMTDEQRTEYLERAGVSRQQIDETVGELPIHAETLRASNVTPAQAEQARAAIHQVLADAAIITAKYNALVAASTTADASEVDRDRRQLGELFADEYTLMNPFGEEQDKAHVVEAMVRGMIHYDGMGRAGFEAHAQSLRVYGDSAVVIGDYQMRASSEAQNAQTGEAYQQDISGNYRITNNYVFRDNRWQAASTQMTQQPVQPAFTLTPGA